MTHRERMLAAYRRQAPNQVPVSPELWYDFSVPLDPDCSWQDICLGKYPLWKAPLAAHRHFGSAAWLIAGAGGGYILASGDWIIVETPLENLYAMVVAGEKY